MNREVCTISYLEIRVVAQMTLYRPLAFDRIEQFVSPRRKNNNAVVVGHNSSSQFRDFEAKIERTSFSCISSTYKV